MHCKPIARVIAYIFLVVLGTVSIAVALPSGLIHHWQGEGNAQDSVGGANGTLGTTTTFAAGLNGQAFSFNGQQSSIVTLPVNIGPNVLPQMTMGMWVNLGSVANNRGWVMGHDNGGFDRSLILHDDRYGFGLAAGVGYSYGSSLPRPLDSLGVWHCVAVAYDAVAQQATVYFDGSVQTLAAFNGTGEPNATLGGLANFGSHTVDALVDEVFIFNRELSKAEIDQVCAAFAEPDSDGDGVPDNEDECPNSDLSATIVIDGCNSGVPNTLFPSGCTISDFIAACAEGASNHGQFVSCVSHLTNDLKKAGTITGQQKGAIQSCAARADIP